VNLHITKDEINRLPMRQYEGSIHLIRTSDDAERAAAELKKETLLGFDTETRPTFRVGEYYQPSLLQLATGTDIFLFQLKLTGLTPALCDVLSSPDILKTGVSIRPDVSELRKLTDFEPAGFVELATHAKQAHIKNLGLRGLAALLLGFRISKREQTSNWAKNELSDSQLRYAATDAWLGREIYRHMETLGLIKNSAQR
jgi:ribonuclease D